MELFGGKVKLDLSVWDITKSIAAIIALIYVINFMGKAEKFLNKPPEKWDKTTIEMLAAGVAKAQVAENTKSLNAAIKALEKSSKALQSAKANNEKIQELGQAVAKIGDNTESIKGEIERFKDRPTATLASANVQLKDANGDKYTIATARYSPDVPPGIDKWSFNTWPRTIHANVVMTETEEGKPNRYVELWTQSEWEKFPNRKQPLEVTSLKWDKREFKDTKFRFAPRIGFSGIFGTEAIIPAIDYSLFSYGRTEVDMTWRFLDLSVGGNKEDTLFNLTPFSYNLGKTLPVISNLFIGPAIGYKFGAAGYSYGLSTSIPF